MDITIKKQTIRHKDINQFWLWDYYEVYENWLVRSKPRKIEMTNRRWTINKYIKPSRILKPEIKHWNKNTKQLRYKLKGDQWWKTIYNAKIVYSVFKNIPYDNLDNIHFKDGNSLNCALYNLYQTKNWKKQRTKK